MIKVSATLIKSRELSNLDFEGSFLAFVPALVYIHVHVYMVYMYIYSYMYMYTCNPQLHVQCTCVPTQ